MTKMAVILANNHRRINVHKLPSFLQPRDKEKKGSLLSGNRGLDVWEN